MLIKKHGDIKWLGGTKDDAAGEAFDKSARLLGLPYPGGPAISKEAKSKQTENLKKYPRPLIKEDSLDFSFSGLKTSVLRSVEGKKLSKEEVKQNSAEIQQAIADVLVNKSIKAIEKHNPKSFLLSGGVAANTRLREKLTKEIEDKFQDVKLFIPKPILCTDNAVMIATSAYYNQNEIPWKKVSANPQLNLEN